MDIEKQCCTLEQAKKLKELGVKQESLFYWQNNKVTSSPIDRPSYDDQHMRCSLCDFDLNISGKELYCHCSKWTAKDDLEPWEWHSFASGNYIQYSVFTVAELGEMLRDSNYYTIDDSIGIGEAERHGFSIFRHFTSAPDLPFNEVFNTEAEARAALLIHLLESKTITATEVNERK